MNIIVTEGPEPDTSYIHVGNFVTDFGVPIPRHVKHKLNEAMLEHCNYVRKMLARIKLSQNPQVMAELFIAWRPNEIKHWGGQTRRLGRNKLVGGEKGGGI